MAGSLTNSYLRHRAGAGPRSSLFSECHLEVRILHAQPATVASVGHFQLMRKGARLPRVSAGSPRLCIGKFQEFGSQPRILRASLWSRIFNIRISIAETRFEVPETEL
jgi:hypothetical protein